MWFTITRSVGWVRQQRLRSLPMHRAPGAARLNFTTYGFRGFTISEARAENTIKSMRVEVEGFSQTFR